MNRNQIKEILIPFLEDMKKDNFIIYGTGEVAEIYCEEIKIRFGEDAIHYFINGTSMPNSKMANKPILHYSELQKIEKDKYIYILATVGSSADDMKRRLIEAGVLEKNILLPVTYFNQNELERVLRTQKKIHVLPEFDNIEECNNFIEVLKKYIDFNNTKICYSFYVKDYDEIVENNLGEIKFHPLENIDKISRDEIVMVRYADKLLTYKNRSIKSIFCIDEQFLYGIFLKMMIAINRSETSEKDKFREVSKVNFLKLKDIANRSVGIGIIGNGPSLENAVRQHEQLWEKTFNIVCNYIYKANGIMEILQPKLYTILDIVFITDDTEGMHGIIRYIQEHNCYLCVPEEWMPILIRRYGIGLDKLIGVELVRDEIMIPNENSLKMCRLGSVILGMSVPVGLAFCNKLYFVGCDGIDLEKEKITWENSKEMATQVQFNKNTLFGLADLDGYINGTMIAGGYKKLFQFLDKKEVEIYNLTHSYFEELEKKYIDLDVSLL